MANHEFFGPWINKYCAHFHPKKLFEKIYVKKIQAIMDFWAHGLTNVQHTWKNNNKLNISLNHQNLNYHDFLNSWYNKLLVRPTYLDFLSTATQISGPSHKFIKPRWAENKSIKPWNIIHSAFKVDFLSNYIFLSLAFNLVSKKLNLEMVFPPIIIFF